jgi:proton translocating ATP synthase F1 alpha subunit
MNIDTNINSSEHGFIVNIADNIISLTGLYNCFVGELINFKEGGFSKYQGFVFTLEKRLVKVTLARGNQRELKCGDIAYRTHNWIKTKAGLGVLGQIISPLGDVLNISEINKYTLLLGNLLYTEYVNVHFKVASIIERDPIYIPVLTGITAIDCFLPIGCGQRELIIGDLNSGKTSLAVTILLNQSKISNKFKFWRTSEQILNNEFKGRGFIPSIYVAVGRKRSEVVRIKNLFTFHDTWKNTCIVYTGPDDLAALQYLAPYAGSAIGNWFMRRGFHSIIVYDDLSQHAIAFRQISLLLKRPPGREAYPGDVFYLHARLLERSAQLTRYYGGGSLTALPIVETKGGEIAAYIPTNVISITDGQIYLSFSVINRGRRPGIDLGLSVSRVGSAAQYLAMKDVSKTVKIEYGLYKIYEHFSKIGSDIDSFIMVYVRRGKQMNAFMTQPLYKAIPFYQQVIGLYCISSGYTDQIDLKYISAFFDVLFSGYGIDIYLEEEEDLGRYFYGVDAFESMLIINSFDVFRADIDLLCRLYKDFFTDVVLPKLADDSELLLYSE